MKARRRFLSSGGARVLSKGKAVAEPPRLLKKICMVGPVCVGKTSLVSRYVRSTFSDIYHSTVGVKVDKKIVPHAEGELTLMLWDLAGDDDFQRLRMSYLRGAAGYLLVVDASRRATLALALDIQRRVIKAIGDVPFVLVINKSDLLAQCEIDAGILAEPAKAGWSIVRTSAKDGTGVEEAFAELARKVIQRGQGAGA